MTSFNVLSLPTVEETTLKVTYGDKQVEIDIFDFQELKKESIDYLRTLGIEFGHKEVLDALGIKVTERYGITLTPRMLTYLSVEVSEMEDVIKKKYSHLYVTVASTEPNQSSDPVETQS